MIRGIVKDSAKLRDALKKRFKELKLTQQDVADDALRMGWPSIRRQAINIFLNDPYAPGGLNEEQIIWLAFRYDIGIALKLGIADKTGKYNIPEKYNQERAFKKLVALFPQTKLPK